MNTKAFASALAGFAVVTLTAAQGDNWAVLVAGSNGYYNYRHQADVSHAYKLLREMGNFDEDKIITMMYNDVANSTDNPFPGKLFNEPGGPDVYEGIVVDYQGEDVTAETFLNVLTGRKQGATENGKVLESSCDKNGGDNVFVYFSDHGATGLICMPTGEPLYANDLNKALEYMHKHCMYHELVFYLEACESGSIFDGILSNSTNIYATTAASSEQPSYAFYYNETLSTYMADEYSIRWMQDSTKHWHQSNPETLQQQFDDVSRMVKESTPQEFGDKRFCKEPIKDFEGEGYQNKTAMLKLLRNSIDHLKGKEPWTYTEDWEPSTQAANSRDVKLAVLQHRYLAARLMGDKLDAADRVEEELEYRLEIDLVFDQLVRFVTGRSHERYVVTDVETNAFKYGHIRPTNWNCLKKAYSSYEKYCEKFSDYSLKYVNALSNLCEIFDAIELIEDGLQTICG